MSLPLSAEATVERVGSGGHSGLARRLIAVRQGHRVRTPADSCFRKELEEEYDEAAVRLNEQPSKDGVPGKNIQQLSNLTHFQTHAMHTLMQARPGWQRD